MTLIEPIEGIIGQLISDVAFLFYNCSIDIKNAVILGIVVSLTRKAHPVIETRLGTVPALSFGFIAPSNVPFSNKRGIVA